VNIKHLFTKNSAVHNNDNGFAKNIHLPITNLTIYQKYTHYTGIKVFNYQPTDIKNVANEIQVFKKTLSDFFLTTHFVLLMKILMLINDIHS
jgi:hypothetical protein